MNFSSGCHSLGRVAESLSSIDVDLGGTTCRILDGGSMKLELFLGKRFYLNLAMRPVLVRSKKANILLDCSAGTGGAYGKRFGLVPPSTPIRKQIEEAGVSPSKLDLVVLSHLHFDHVLGAFEGKKPLFPKAEFCIQQAEWDYSLSRGSALALMLKESLAPGRLRLVKGDTTLCPGLDGFLTPGHSPGHMVTRIKGEEDTAWFLGDLVPMRRSLLMRPDPHSDPDPEMALSHRRRITAAMAWDKAMALFYHDPKRVFARPRPF